MAEDSSLIKVGILPYELRYEVKLGGISLQLLDWPGEATPTSGTIADLSVSDHVVVYPSSKRLLRSFGPLNCQIDLLMAEPLIIHGKYYKNIWWLKHKFKYILCRYSQYAEKYTNVLQLPVVESWVDGKSVPWPAAKYHNCSLIASEKTGLIGHKLRHEVVEWIKQESVDVEVIGRGYKPFELKQDGLLTFHYSIIIENVPELSCFTEKLIDCMLCGTLPIYYGPKDIGDFFNARGIIRCNCLADFQAAIATVINPPNAAQLAAMAENRQIALGYGDLQQRIVDRIRYEVNK